MSKISKSASDLYYSPCFFVIARRVRCSRSRETDHLARKKNMKLNKVTELSDGIDEITLFMTINKHAVNLKPEKGIRKIQLYELYKLDKLSLLIVCGVMYVHNPHIIFLLILSLSLFVKTVS